MAEPAGKPEANPSRRHLVLAFAPIALAGLALAGLALFHCVRG